MTNPVFAAIAQANMREHMAALDRNELALEGEASRKIGFPRIERRADEIAAISEGAAAFAQWCSARGVRSLPARPGTLAAFILDGELIGLTGERLAEAVRHVIDAHAISGHANPAASELVSRALRKAVVVDLPRSWPPEELDRFVLLPRETQTYLAEREKQRDKEVRRCQNEKARADQEIKTLKARLDGDAGNNVAKPTKGKTMGDGWKKGEGPYSSSKDLSFTKDKTVDVNGNPIAKPRDVSETVDRNAGVDGGFSGKLAG